MDTQKKKVAVIGALNVDIGGRADSPLARGDSIPGRVSSALGGVGWNIARDCSLLGADTAFFSLLGRDEHEAVIRADGERFGVDLARCRWEERQNNRYLYICDERGDVAAAVNDMALCSRVSPELAASWLPELAGYDAAVIDTNLQEETLAFLGENMTVPLAADCVSVAKCVRLRPILPRLRLLKANRAEAAILTGFSRPLDSAKALLDAGVKRAVISLGPDGVLCAEGKSFLRQNAVNAHTVDATGAGDSLMAALVVGLANGLPLARCAQLGAAAAGVTISHDGAVTEALRDLVKNG